MVYFWLAVHVLGGLNGLNDVCHAEQERAVALANELARLELDDWKHGHDACSTNSP